MSLEQRQTDAWREGKDAQRRGWSTLLCPYSSGTDKRREWIEAHYESQRQEQQKVAGMRP